ncbi:allophanate hydrolase [Roseobacter cerasinus]|nr:allophanate hydrolase [Roseobacter cerasinus]
MSAAIPLTLDALRSAYAQGTSPVEVVAQVYDRIDAVADPGIFITLFDRAQVEAAAHALGAYDPNLPLWGVPFAIKDNMDVAGEVTTAGCPDFAYTAEATSTVVQNLLDAGALLIGKTNLDQFATGLVGVRTPYGAPLNSIDPDIVPGGSSGGSGVAVGHGIVTFALGTDTAGSGRVPAALNNIVGLKPTLGSLSATGLVPACRTLDTISVFALTVADAYAAFGVAASYDAADSYSRAIGIAPLAQPAPYPVIAIPSPDSIRFEGDTAQAASFASVIEALQEQGAVIREIDFSALYDVAEMLYYGPWVAERYAATEALMTTNPDALFPVTRKIISGAEALTAVDAFKGLYRLKDLIRKAEPLIDGCDALCVPTIPTFFTVAELEADPIGPNNKLGTYTNFVNLMDMCGIAVPAPPRSDGRPGSVTFLASAGEDAKVASLATRVEAMGTRTLGATDWARPAAPVLAAPCSSAIQIAVCGAHMDGLPLNEHLTSRGAIKVKTTRTAADYGFYALPSDDVARPALVRHATEQGAEVSLEIWEMPEAQFGSFMKTIPAPLGIGTIKLVDGSTVQGFLCEAVAIDGATDITDLADWRAYIAQSRT